MTTRRPGPAGEVDGRGSSDRVAVDAFAFEPQFLDHLAPVWRLIPKPARGTLFVDQTLVARAATRGVEAVALSGGEIRGSSAPPTALRAPGPMAFVASIGDTKIARRLGYRRFAFIEHGAGQSYRGEGGISARLSSYAGGDDRDDTELVLVPNDYAAQAWRATYPETRVEVVGSPRLADLPQRDATLGLDPVVAVSFHWPAFAAPEAGTAVGHYLRALEGVARRFTTIGHAHPKGDWPSRMERVYRRAGIAFVDDFDEVSRRADVYVCDNSSTMFEFAATGRPVVVLNHPQYRRHVNHGGRFWDWASVGVQVDQPGELIAAIERALADPPDVRTERERVVGLVYPERDGVAPRAARIVSEWATT